MKILVLGGTGATGRLIRDYLSHTKWDIHFSSRKPPKDALPEHIQLDVTKKHAADIIACYDWVINCTGPFETLKNRVADLCITAGTSAIDVNDSIDARRAIMQLDGAACAAQVSILTGFGLCPGLSTALMMSLPCSAVTKVIMELTIGAGQASGAAAISSMFHTMHNGYRVLQHGTETIIPRTVSEQETIGYECPDIDIVNHIYPDVQDYEYRVRFSALKQPMLVKLQTSRLFTLPLISGVLARFAAKKVTQRANETNSPQPATLTATVASAEETMKAVITGKTSYEFTALCAAATLVHIAESPPSFGCYDLTGLPELRAPLLQFITDHGATLSIDEG